MTNRKTNTDEVFKASAAIASTAGAVIGAAFFSPLMLGASIAVGGYALYRMITTEIESNQPQEDESINLGT